MTAAASTSSDGVIVVKIHAPSQLEARRFEWPSSMLVGDAATQSADAFGVHPENPSFQVERGTVLDRTQSLSAAGVQSGDTMELVSAGGGVLLLPSQVSQATVEAELPALIGYAERHRWDVEWLQEELQLRLCGRLRAAGQPLFLIADVNGYRAVPPAWTIHEADGVHPGRQRLIEPKDLPGGVGSIFHACGICAPFNRLAYKENLGPHSDWGGASHWLGVKGTVNATTLAEMLAVIVGHLDASPGWKS